MKPGEDWKFNDIVQVMIRRSDNIATNTLMDFLGKPALTDFMKRLGLGIVVRISVSRPGNNKVSLVVRFTALTVTLPFSARAPVQEKIILTFCASKPADENTSRIMQTNFNIRNRY
jgi:beta-lactamase class A